MAGDNANANNTTQTTPTATDTTAMAVNQSITALVSSFALQNSITGLRPFNGTDWPLKDFIQDIKNGAVSVPADQQTNYLRAVVSKLRGAARDSSYGKNFNNLDDLIKHLKNRFAPYKDYNYYIEKLNNLRMRQDQSVGDFRDMINILLSSAKNALKEEQGDGYNDVMMIPLNSLVLNIFLKGLPGYLSEKVDLLRPADLDEAYNEAIRIESHMEAKIIPDHRHQRGRYQQNNYKPRNNSYNQQRNNGYTNTYNNGYNSRGENSRGHFVGTMNDRPYNPQSNQIEHNQQYFERQGPSSNYTNNCNFSNDNRNYNNQGNGYNQRFNGQNNFRPNREGGNTFNRQNFRNNTFDPDANTNSP